MFQIFEAALNSKLVSFNSIELALNFRPKANAALNAGCQRQVPAIQIDFTNSFASTSLFLSLNIIIRLKEEKNVEDNENVIWNFFDFSPHSYMLQYKFNMVSCV